MHIFKLLSIFASHSFIFQLKKLHFDLQVFGVMEVPVFWLQKSCPALCEHGALNGDGAANTHRKSCLWGCGAERLRIQYVCSGSAPHVCGTKSLAACTLVCSRCTYDSVLCSCVCVCVDYNWERRATLGVTSVGFHEWKRHSDSSIILHWQAGKLANQNYSVRSPHVNAGCRLECLCCRLIHKINELECKKIMEVAKTLFMEIALQCI
jgi:hypothetical protein